MDIVTYALCKKLAASAVTGISNITQSDDKMIISTNDGNTFELTIPKPKDGIDGTNGIDGVDGKDGLSIINIKIDENNHLICTLSDNSTIDAGELPTNSGEIPNLDYATKDDIDEMFKNLDPIRPEVVDYATKEDIDKLFE